jgi:hypothetical protein
MTKKRFSLIYNRASFKMSLSLDDLKVEMLEYQMRVEEVFTGMDAYITKLEKKLKKTENRVDILEGQLRSIVDALEDGWIIDSK